MQVIDKRRLNMEVEDKDMLLDQLRKEIEILQRLSHPNIVAFEEVGAVGLYRLVVDVDRPGTYMYGWLTRRCGVCFIDRIVSNAHPHTTAHTREQVVETADKIFVVMELVQGGELFEYLLDRGPLPEAAAVHIMRQVRQP